MSQRSKPEEIIVRRFYDGETSLQAAFQPVLEASIRDAVNERLEHTEKSSESIQNP